MRILIMIGLLLTSAAHAEGEKEIFDIQKLSAADFTYNEEGEAVFNYRFESEGCDKGGNSNPAQFRLKVVSVESYFANGRRRLHATLKVEVFQALELRCRIFDDVTGSIKLKDLFAQQAATLPFDINSEPTEAGIEFVAPEVRAGIVLD